MTGKKASSIRWTQSKFESEFLALVGAARNQLSEEEYFEGLQSIAATLMSLIHEEDDIFAHAKDRPQKL